MMLMRHASLRLLFASVLTGALSIAMLGCESTDQPIESAVVEHIESSSPPRSPVVEPAAAQPGEALGWVVHDVAAPLLLDPLTASYRNHFLLGEVFSGLVSIGAGPDYALEPDLASSWSVSDDGLRYTFKLRDGLRFSDGVRLTAEDVKWSWERALAVDYATDRARGVLGGIVGADEMLSGDAESIDGITVIDDSTLSVELVRPMAHFLGALADPAASVLRRENFHNWGTANWVRHGSDRVFDGPLDVRFEELPAGTGPFMFARHDHPYDVTLLPNPNYWRGAPIGLAGVTYGNPYLAAYPWLPPVMPELREFDSLEAPVDWVRSITGDEDDPIAPRREGLEIFEPVAVRRAPEVTWLAFNSAIEPFNDVEFRRALLLASDRSHDAGYFDVGSPRWSAAGLLPPGFAGHSPREWGGPERGAALAALERWQHGAAAESQTLRPLILEGEPFPGFIRNLTRNWVDWFDVEIDEWDEEHTPRREFNAALESGTLQMRYVHVKPRYPDPCAILCRVPDLFGPNAQSDETRELSAMLDDAAATADRAARIAKYQAIEDHILDRALVIPVFWDDGVTYRLVKPYISGYKVPAYGGSMYEDVVVDTTHPDYPQERLTDGWLGE